MRRQPRSTDLPDSRQIHNRSSACIEPVARGPAHAIPQSCTRLNGVFIARLVAVGGFYMQIELSRSDAELVRDILRQRVKDLDQEIVRTDRSAFKHELRELERSVERVLGEFSSALEAPPSVS
jgi:hypothetical protein